MYILKHYNNVGPVYAGAFGYVDNVAVLTPSLYCLKQMIKVCESFKKLHFIEFNLIKSKFSCLNLNIPIFLNGKRTSIGLPVVSDMMDILVTLFQHIFRIGT